MAVFGSNKVEYAGVPFVLDRVLPSIPRRADRDRLVDGPRTINPKVVEPDVNIIDYLNSILSSKYLCDFSPPSQYGGRNIGHIARPWVTEEPNKSVGIGEWFYPTGASRWSVFRGLATSSQVKAMVAAAYPSGGPTTANTLTLINSPISPDNPLDAVGSYTVSSPMYLLPPRPLSEHGGACEGLYLVTLVDERYYWQFRPATISIYSDTTWEDVVAVLAAALNTSFSAVVDPIFTRPEADSPLWCNAENAAALLDAVAANLALTVVRKLSGSIVLESTETSYATALANRGPASRVVRYAGGDMFYSGGTLPAGPLIRAKEAVVPATIRVTFPQYVTGDDPVPHLANGRYFNQRPSCWYEDSYGDVFVESVPITSGDTHYVVSQSGVSADTYVISGLTGKGTYTLHTTAKALYPTVSGLVNQDDPDNAIDLRKLAMGLAKNYYAQQASLAWDESYPGTFAWTPEGFNDIVWTHSATLKQASTRVMRSEWNCIVREFSHATPPADSTTQTNHPKGVGGPSVAQAARDAYALGSFTPPLLCSGLGLGDRVAAFGSVNNLPTTWRWRGTIDDEAMLFEGTSGGISSGAGVSGFMVSIARRAIDGTIEAVHAAESEIGWTLPNTSYGNNLYTFDKGFFCFPGEWTDTGIQEAIIPCPLRSVQTLSASGTSGFGPTGYPATLYSGRVCDYDPNAASGAQYPQDRLIWIGERNNGEIKSGKVYGGQLAGFSVYDSGQAAAIYLVNEYPAGSSTPSSGVKLNVRDSYTLSGFVQPTLNGSFNSGATTATLNRIDNLPTDYRWEALIDSEWVLFEGTSGGATVGVATRGLNGTTEANHANGATVTWGLPQRTSGIDTLAFGPGFLVQPGTPWNSGNNEATVLCPTRTVRLLSASGANFSGALLYSGVVLEYETAIAGASLASGPYVNPQLIWIRPRNEDYLFANLLRSGNYYNGQFVGWTASGTAAGTCAPLYLIETPPAIFAVSGAPSQANYFTMQNSGLSTDAYQQIGGLSFGTSGTAAGLQWWGGVKNTSGANALDVRYTWHDVWGNEYSVEKLGVSPGEIDSFNAALFSGSLLSYGLGTNSGIIEVKSNVAGQHTGWALRSTYF